MNTEVTTKIVLGGFLLLIGVALTTSYLAFQLDKKIEKIKKNLQKPERDSIDYELDEKKHTNKAKRNIIKKWTPKQ